MKKAFLMLALSANLAYADSITINSQLQCDKHDVVVNALQTKYKESPVWMSQKKEIVYGLFLNKTTKTWTFVLTDNNIMCVVAEGEGFVSTNPI